MTRPIQTEVVTSPHEAVQAMLQGITPVAEARVALQDLPGRVLSRPILADRDSPPHDVSAMDGYAIRVPGVDPKGTSLRIHGEIAIGRPPLEMPADGCLKISTGACVPRGCDGVIPREQVDETRTHITLPPGLAFREGQHIRRRGENCREGTAIVPGGTAVTPPVAGALAAFGYGQAWARECVRIAVITTGSELVPVDMNPEPWQIRDSNGQTLLCGLRNHPWADVVSQRHVPDGRGILERELRACSSQSDLIITTGGVSMGDHDDVRPALLGAGAQIIYHRLPIRPGKPSLGAWLPDPARPGRSVPVIALPGNPIAVAVGLGLFVAPVARAIAGLSEPVVQPPRVRVHNPPEKPLGLWRYLPAKKKADGVVELLRTKGSGDLANAALAEGYVEVPPDAAGPGPWPLYDVTL